MSYQGNKPPTSFESPKKDRFTGITGTTCSLTYAVSSVADILVWVNSVKQDFTNYSVSGSTLTLSGTLVSSDIVEVTYVGRTYGSIAPTDASVGTSALQDDAVTTAKINDDAVTAGKLSSTAVDNTNTNSTLITAQTEKSSLVDADKFLISDSAASGALKYVQKSNLGGDMVKIASASDYSTGVAKLNIDQFSTTYKFYKFYATLRHESGGTDLRFRWRTSGSEQGGSYYIYTGHRSQINSGGTTADDIHFSGFYTSYAQVTNNSTASNNHDILIDWTFYDPMRVVLNRPYVQGDTQYYRDDDVFRQNTFGCKYNTASINYDGFALWAGSGNIEDYQWVMYGVKA